MINKILPMTVLSGFLLLPTPGVKAENTKAAGSNATLKAAFQSLYNHLDAAIARKDTEGVLAFYTEDIVSLRKDGQVSVQGKPKIRKIFTAMIANATTLSERDTVQSLTAAGKTVTVIKKSDWMINGTEAGTSSIDQEVWIKTGNRWRIKQHRQLR